MSVDAGRGWLQCKSVEIFFSFQFLNEIKNQSYTESEDREEFRGTEENQRVNRKKGRNKGSRLLISCPGEWHTGFSFTSDRPAVQEGVKQGEGCSWLSGFCSHLQQESKRRATIQIKRWEPAKKSTKHNGNWGQRRWEMIHYKCY